MQQQYRRHTVPFLLHILLRATKLHAKISYSCEKGVYFLFKKAIFFVKTNEKETKTGRINGRRSPRMRRNQKAPTSRRGF